MGNGLNGDEKRKRDKKSNCQHAEVNRREIKELDADLLASGAGGRSSWPTTVPCMTPE